jgi:DNA (cytosine-5)-methyltransferase 1
MPLNNSISVNDLESKEVKAEISDFFDEPKAIVTHYLHNISSGVAKHYEGDALQILDKFVAESETPITKENLLRQLLNEVEQVPFPTPKQTNFTFID